MLLISVVIPCAWMIWLDKTTRDAGWGKIMEDPRIQALGEMPFDGKR